MGFRKDLTFYLISLVHFYMNNLRNKNDTVRYMPSPAEKMAFSSTFKRSQWDLRELLQNQDHVIFSPEGNS